MGIKNIPNCPICLLSVYTEEHLLCECHTTKMFGGNFYLHVENISTQQEHWFIRHNFGCNLQNLKAIPL